MTKHGPALAVLCSAFCCIGLARSATGPSLYSRLGGPETMTAFVRDALDRAAAIDTEPRQLESYLCSIAGGDCASTRAPQLSEAQFLQLVEALRVAMRAHDVPLAARNELLEALAALRRES